MGRIRTFLDDWSHVRRFNALPPKQRSIVFYAEDRDSWPHFGPIVRELAESTGRTVCYLTSSRADPVLQFTDPRIRAFCVGDGAVRTSLFLSLQADVCVMTMPDLQTFHLKRSRRAAVHYVYVFHSMVSTHMIYRKGAFDAYDTILCPGPHHIEEIRATEAAYGLKPKRLIEQGYVRLDTMSERAEQIDRGITSAGPASGHILIAPSWGPDGLLETYGAEPVRSLLAAGFRVTVRPHPMTRRKCPECLRAIQAEFEGHPALVMERGVASHASLETADVMISDWSGAALEFAFAYERPVLFVDVPRKVNNPEYTRIACEPIEVSIREQIGRIVSPKEMKDLPAIVRQVRSESDAFRPLIRRARERTVYNIGSAARVAAGAIAGIADASGPQCKEEQLEVA